MWDPSLQSVLVSARSFSAICFGFNSLNNLLEAATFYKFPFLRSFMVSVEQQIPWQHAHPVKLHLWLLTLSELSVHYCPVFPSLQPIIYPWSLSLLISWQVSFSRSPWSGTCWILFKSEQRTPGSLPDSSAELQQSVKHNFCLQEPHYLFCNITYLSLCLLTLFFAVLSSKWSVRVSISHLNSFTSHGWTLPGPGNLMLHILSI